MRKSIRARLVSTGGEVQLRPGTVALAASKTGAAENECFLCTAPDPRNHKDGCDAYLSGFVHAVMAMTDEERPVKLCAAHETQLREMLVVHVQDVESYFKLGIETKVL